MVKIDGYAIDIATSEEHDLEAEVTEFPIEGGGSVTDHVRIKPPSVTIKGIISDTPIGAVADLRGSNMKPSEEGRVVLEAIFAAKEQIELETTLKTYKDMIMESLSFSENGESGEALNFTASFRQVVIETNKRVIIRAIPIGQKKRDMGNLAGKPAGWIGTDDKGRNITANKLGPGIEPTYTREDGTVVSTEEARDAAKKNDAVIVKYDKNGHAVPVDSRDFQPHTPQQKKPYWAPVPRTDASR